MKLDITKRTHAQNRFLRRLNNCEGKYDESPIGKHGEPIPGALTPVEIEHKARRKKRRLEKNQLLLKELPTELFELSNELSKAESFEPKDKKEAAARSEKIAFLLNHIDHTKDRLEKAKLAFSRLV